MLFLEYWPHRLNSAGLDEGWLKDLCLKQATQEIHRQMGPLGRNSPKLSSVWMSPTQEHIGNGGGDTNKIILSNMSSFPFRSVAQNIDPLMSGWERGRTDPDWKIIRCPWDRQI